MRFAIDEMIFEVKPIDETHLKTRWVNSENWRVKHIEELKGTNSFEDI